MTKVSKNFVRHSERDTIIAFLWILDSINFEIYSHSAVRPWFLILANDLISYDLRQII